MNKFPQVSKVSSTVLMNEVTDKCTKKSKATMMELKILKLH